MIIASILMNYFEQVVKENELLRRQCLDETGPWQCDEYAWAAPAPPQWDDDATWMVNRVRVEEPISNS